MVPEKGASIYAIETLTRHILWLGYDRITFRSDGERAVRALIEKTAERLKARGIQVGIDVTPVGDSQAGGLQEAAVQQFKARCRTIWYQAADLHFGGCSKANHEKALRLLPWCVQYAGQLVTRSCKNAEGKTPWTMVTGRREFPRPLIPWGEKVHFIPGGGKSKPGVMPKWEAGIFLSFIEATNEYVIGTPDRIVKSSNAKRMTRMEASDPALFVSIKGTPWKLSESETVGVPQIDIPIRVDMPTAVPESELPRTRSAPPPGLVRRVSFRKDVELARYGFTDGCPGCLSAALGKTPRGHSEGCRTRLEEAMSRDIELGGSSRIEEADARRAGQQSAGASASVGQDLAAGDSVPGPAPLAAGATVPMEQDGLAAGATVPTQGPSEETSMDTGIGQKRGPDPMAEDEPAGRRKKLTKGTDLSALGDLFELSIVDPEDEEFVALVSEAPKLKAKLLRFDDEICTMQVPVPKVHVAEVFCPPRLTTRAPMHGLSPGIAVDLRTGWDLNDERHVAALWRYIKLVKPLVILGSPECKGFSRLQGLNIGKPGYEESLKQGMRHLRLCCEIYEHQMRHGRYFVHEHPWSADSWGTSLW